MTQVLKKYYTPEEYLALEEKAEYKSEYFRGEILQMAGTNLNHDRLAIDTLNLLQSSFAGKPFEAFSSDVRLLVKKNGLYTYPDVSVVCGDIIFLEGRDDTITNPIMLVEVLSKSTRNYDRGAKFELYRELPSVQIYLILDSLRVYAEYHQRISERVWQMETYNNLQDTVKLTAFELEIPLAEVYKRVNFADAPPTPLKRKTPTKRRSKNLTPN
jgi:Uma2 family endonuclease